MSDFVDGLNKARREYEAEIDCACDMEDFENGFMEGANWKSSSHNPTHHAVIDEYGEIIYARRISGLLDAVEQCEYYIEQCRKDPVTRHSAKGWTVKEVTLHD